MGKKGDNHSQVDESLDPRLLSALLGLLAHDLRNPLSALQSNVSFLRSVVDPDDRDVVEALLDAQSSCQGVADIIDNVEVVAYVLRGSPGVELGPMRLSPVVSEVVSRMEATAASHETRIELSGVDELRELSVVSNREMLMRALANLIRNGIQHGGREPVEVRLAMGPAGASITIADRGPAVSDEIGEEAFSAAGQLAAKSARGGRYGRGLGLYCAKVAAEAAGARLEVEPAETSRFVLQMRTA